MKVFSNTDIGLSRSSNQDTFRQGVAADNCLWSAVCDGMGGAVGGNIASGIAADTIESILTKELHENSSEEELRSLCFRAVSEANSAVFSRAVDEPALKGMGTTVVLALVCGNKLYLSHVGDSRFYRKREGSVTQITTDHSYVQDLVARGEITKDEAKNHPHRNIITRSVGVHSMVENDYQELDILPGDIYVSCSDGLSNYLTDECLNGLLEQYGEDEITEALTQHALKSGGSDNITVSVIYI